MGAIFSWSAIERGRIPAIGAFDALRTEALRRACACDAIVAAAVYGSVARGDHGIRSDFDLLLVHRTKERMQAVRLLNDLNRLAVESHIVMSAHLLSVSRGRSGDHSFGPSYREDWRKLRAGGSVIGIPALHVRAPVVTMAEEIVKSLPLRFDDVQESGDRFRRVFRSWRLDNIDAALALAQRTNNRPLHFYVACARWLMRWKYGWLPCESRDDVTRAFSADPEFARLHVPFLRLCGLDRAYDLLLTAAIGGEVERQEYLLSVRRILRHAIAANEEMICRAKEMVAMRRSCHCARGASVAA